MDELRRLLRALRPDDPRVEASLELALAGLGRDDDPPWEDVAGAMLRLPGCDEEAVTRAICLRLGRKLCYTERFDLPAFVPEYTRRFPRRLALEWGMLPVKQRGTDLFVATSLPLSPWEASELGASLELRVHQVHATPRSLRSSFERIYGPLASPAPGTQPFPFALRSQHFTPEGFRQALLALGAASQEELADDDTGDWEDLAARLLRRPARDPEALARAIARTAMLSLHRPGPEATVDLLPCRLLPPRLAEELEVLPSGWDGDRFEVAVTRPLSLAASTELRLYVGAEPVQTITTPRALQAGLVRRYGELEARRRAAARGATPLPPHGPADELALAFQRGRAGGRELVVALRTLRDLPLGSRWTRAAETRLPRALVLQALHAARETPDPQVWRPILEELLQAPLDPEARPLLGRCLECAPRGLVPLAERILAQARR